MRSVLFPSAVVGALLLAIGPVNRALAADDAVIILTGSVSCLAFSPDGKTVATSDGKDKQLIKVWDTTTGKERLTLEGHSDGVLRVAFSPDGRTIASAGDRDQTVKLWEIASGRERATVKWEGHVSYLAFSSDCKSVFVGVTAVEGDRYSIRLHRWDGSAHKREAMLKGHLRPVRSLALTGDGKTLASGSGLEGRGELKLWDVTTGKEKFPLKVDPRVAYSVALSPDGKTLAFAGTTNNIGLLDTTTGKQTRTLSGHTDWVHTVAFSPDGKRLASASADNTIKVWDSVSGRELFTLHGHSDSVYHVAFSPDGKRVASGSFDNTVRVWALKE